MKAAFEGHTNLAKEYFNKKEYEEALKCLNKALEIEPEHPLGLFLRGYVYALTDKHELALNDFNKVVDLSPNFFPGYSLRGKYYFEEEKDLDQALRDLSTAIDISEQMEEGVVRAGIDGRLKEYEQTLQLLNELMVQDRLLRAGIYGMKKEYKKALKDLNRVIELDSNNGGAYLHRGYVYKSLGKLYPAKRDYGKACELGIRPACAWLEEHR